MTTSNTETPACAVCGGNRYVLTNSKGVVRAETCACCDCAICEGEGHIFRQKENGTAYLTECECTRLRNRLRILNTAAIPGKFTHSDFDTYMKHHPSQGMAKRVAQDFVKDFPRFKEGVNRGLVLMGPPGLGKTHLAVSIIKSLVLEKGVDCKFVDFFQLLSDIRHGYSQDMSDQAIIRPYLGSRVLVIDELAKGRNTEWELTVLDQLISSRYNAANKVTLFTTNYASELRIENKSVQSDILEKNYTDTYTRESLQEKIGARIYSRLAEMCKFVMIQGQDIRQKDLAASQRYPRKKR